MTADESFGVTLGQTGLAVHVHDECGAVGAMIEAAVVEQLEDAVVEVLTDAGIHTATVDVFLVDADRIAELNRVHLGHDGPTDVLSFPLDDPDEADGFGFVPHVGDIVLCPVVAGRQAPDHTGDLRGEMLLLTIHAALHLLGHDHAAPGDRSIMQGHEARFLQGFGVCHPGDQG